mmetsp:Transcript_15944/g.26848  ORF Transcript_15944/g.26848 Transcript_15944/m.26848 type:complete len:728 (+) Transcript_15944:127-2310(+)|eukprot:CAMPEP_0174965604 /NCGR_PEP_ID=MMETSP0004_2-20121128/6528_1 /TAXON_ID=420556 /ORGANISM="Ochromonas sp., Strain CCMP1393" /LENGTH=727 /DNA_ID=CAMNT_0016214459 /DNA_START=119 /DNA_END=2302 /DNA_ORIENTATION=+
MEENEQAILDWVNTFEISGECTKLSDLSDGLILADILCEICPAYFERDSLNNADEVVDNWALAAGNVRKILRMLDGYFETVLGKHIDTSHVDASSIAKTSDVDELWNLLELVVGAAVMCEDRDMFIQNIFSLGSHSQAVLKALVEQGMSRVEDIAAEGGAIDSASARAGGTGTGTGTPAAGDGGETKKGGDDERTTIVHSSSSVSEEEQLRVKEMLQHLQSERVRLLGEVSGLEQAQESLKHQLRDAQAQAQQREAERALEEGSDRNRVQVLESTCSQLKAELEESKREQDLRVVECDALRHDLQSATQQLDSLREVQARLEMETHQQADELDIARDKVIKLAKTEQTIEKYQKKLEEMADLKKQNKDLSLQMDKYLDQIADLEGANKGLTTLSKMIEQYKDRAVELETAKFEAESAGKVREQHVQQLTADLSKAKDARRLAQDECASLRRQFDQYLDEAAEKEEAELEAAANEDGGLSLEENYTVETVPMLKEKVKKLERELSAIRTASAAGGSGDAATAANAPAAPAGAADEGSSMAAVAQLRSNLEQQEHQIALLRQELEDVRRLKKDREEALVGAKKELSEVRYELEKANEVVEEQKQNAAAAASLASANQKLAETSNTVQLLQDKLKEKETAIARVEQEKSKLESYTKRSLSTFKEKYMAVLKTLKEEKEDLQQKMRVQLERSERNQATWHREERLISSAMYEIGLRVMDRKIQSQVQQSPP